MVGGNFLVNLDYQHYLEFESLDFDFQNFEVFGVSGGGGGGMLVRLVGPGVVVVEQMVGVHPQSLILNPFARYSFSGLSGCLALEF